MQTEELAESPPARDDFLTVIIVVALVVAPVTIGTALVSPTIHDALAAIVNPFIDSLGIVAEWVRDFVLAVDQVIGL